MSTCGIAILSCLRVVLIEWALHCFAWLTSLIFCSHGFSVGLLDFSFLVCSSTVFACSFHSVEILLRPFLLVFPLPPGRVSGGVPLLYMKRSKKYNLPPELSAKGGAKRRKYVARDPLLGHYSLSRAAVSWLRWTAVQIATILYISSVLLKQLLFALLTYYQIVQVFP